ncbi:MAG: hypothetical protein JWQ14_208, partial [Adhaeribacter sp.]|nr:hypothetical protein [Adhaeribacter sp.]
ATNATGLTAYSELFRHNIITAMPTADSPPEIEYTIRPDPALKRSLPYIITFRGTGAATTTGPPSQDYNTSSSRQQDLTLAIYFRPERTTDQQDATQPGEIPIPDEEPEPQDKSDSLAFNVYPNPVSSYLYIQNNRHVPATLYLYNTQNQLVLTQVLTLQQTIISRSSTVTAGMYFYTIISEGGKIEQTGRLVLL